MIYVSRTYTTGVARSVIRLVKCEACEAEYIYPMVVSAEGEGSSPYFLDNRGAQDRAAREARRQLAKRLRTACRPVPCPGCGRYQRHMRWAAALAHTERLGWAGTVLIVAWLPALVVVALACYGLGHARYLEPMLAASVAVPAAGVLAHLYRGVRLLTFDPNASPHGLRGRPDAPEGVPKDEFLTTAGRVNEERYRVLAGGGSAREFTTDDGRLVLDVWVEAHEIEGEHAIPLRMPTGRVGTLRLTATTADGDVVRLEEDDAALGARFAVRVGLLSERGKPYPV